MSAKDGNQTWRPLSNCGKCISSEFPSRSCIFLLYRLCFFKHDLEEAHIVFVCPSSLNTISHSIIYIGKDLLTQRLVVPMQRFRENAGLRSWIPRSAIGKDAEITKIQKSRGLKDNSIKGCPEFNALDKDQVKNPGRGKFPQNAGEKRIGDTERKSRREKEVQRLNQLRQSLQAAETQSSEASSTVQHPLGGEELGFNTDEHKSEQGRSSIQIPSSSGQNSMLPDNPVPKPVYEYLLPSGGNAFQVTGEIQAWQHPTSTTIKEGYHKRKRGEPEQSTPRWEINDEMPRPGKKARLDTGDRQLPDHADHSHEQNPFLNYLPEEPQLPTYDNGGTGPSYWNDQPGGLIGLPMFESSQESAFAPLDLTQPPEAQAEMPYPTFNQGWETYLPFDALNANTASSQPDLVQPAADSGPLDNGATTFDPSLPAEFDTGITAPSEEGWRVGQETTVEGAYQDGLNEEVNESYWPAFREY